jgi:hypothetical protein
MHDAGEWARHTTSLHSMHRGDSDVRRAQELRCALTPRVPRGGGIQTERGAPGGRRSSSYVRSRRPRGVTSRPGSEVELLGVGAPGIPLWVQHGGSRGRRDIVRWCYSLGSGPVGTARLDECRFRPPPGTSTFVRCLGVTPRGESAPGVAWPALLKAGHHASPGRRSEATP